MIIVHICEELSEKFWLLQMLINRPVLGVLLVVHVLVIEVVCVS
jgi:hypothetical protein